MSEMVPDGRTATENFQTAVVSAFLTSLACPIASVLKLLFDFRYYWEVQNVRERMLIAVELFVIVALVAQPFLVHSWVLEGVIYVLGGLAEMYIVYPLIGRI